MNQHTKGPWHTRYGQSYTAIYAGEKVVGYIDHFNEYDKRLVTSAPDLLEQRDELLEVVCEFVQTMDLLPESDETSLRVWALYDAASKLIEKMQWGGQ